MKKLKLIFYICLILLSMTVNGQDVYKTPSGKKYHLSSCRMVEDVVISINDNVNIEWKVDNGILKK